MISPLDGTKLRRLMVLVPVIIIALWPLSGNFLRERRYVPTDVEKLEPLFSMGGSGMNFAGLIPYFFLYAIAGAAVLYYFIDKRNDSSRTLVLWLGGSSLFFLPALVDALSGQGVSVMGIMTPFMFFLVFVLRAEDFDWLVNLIRAVALTYLYITVAYTVVFFQYATVDNCGICPLSTLRLYGLSQHANSLAIIPVVFVAADLVRGGRVDWLRIMHWITAIVILIGAQSKSPVLSMIISGAIVSVLATRGPMKAVVFSASGLVAVLAAFVWFVIIPETSARGFYDTASNLTGRPVIWSYVVEMWRENMFGYGTGFMKVHAPTGENFYFRTGWVMNTAHNQFLGVLGQAGIAGAVGFIFYFLMIPYLVLKSACKEKFAVLFLYLTIFIWCVTEQLLSALIISERFFLHLVLFYFVAMIMKRGQLGSDERAPLDALQRT